MPNGPYPDRAKQGRFLAWTGPSKNPVQDPCPCWRAPGTPSDEQAKSFATTDRLRILAGPKNNNGVAFGNTASGPLAIPRRAGPLPKVLWPQGLAGPGKGVRWQARQRRPMGPMEAIRYRFSASKTPPLHGSDPCVMAPASGATTCRYFGPRFMPVSPEAIPGRLPRPKKNGHKRCAYFGLRPTFTAIWGLCRYLGEAREKKGIRGGDTLFPLRSHNVAGIAGTPGPFPGPRPKGRGLSMVHPRGPCGGLFGLLLRLYYMDPVLPPGPI